MSQTADSNQEWTPLVTGDIEPEVMNIVSEILNEIPELPLSVNKIIELVSDEDASLGQLVDLISSDPALVSNILRVVNSSYYGLRHKTDNLQLAVVLLGFNEVKKITMRSFVTRSLQQSKMFKKYDFETLWLHSYLVSVCAESFAGEDDPQQRGVLLTLGLLHDIGKFALIGIGLAMKEKNLIPRTPGTIPDAICLMEKEERLFGINHPVVGGMLARKWNLSERFCTVLEYHHYPSFFDWGRIPPDYEHEIAILSMADYIVNTFFETKNNIPEPVEKAYQLIGFEPSTDAILTVDLREKLLNAREFFGLLK